MNETGMRRLTSAGRRAFLRTVALAGGLAGVGTAAAATTIDTPTRIDSPGEYVLGSDVTYSGDGGCIEIVADGVTLDGQDHTLTGSGRGTGVVITGANVTVTNLTARRFRKAAEARETSAVELREVTATGMAGNGLNLLDTRDSLVVDCTAVDNTYDGIELERSDGNEVRGNTVQRNRDGIELENADDNLLANNVVCDNTDSQFNIDALSSGNTRTGNDTTCDESNPPPTEEPPTDEPPSDGETPTRFSSPTRIESPGTYYLDGDIDYSGSGGCVEIVADDVVLEGEGHTLSGARQGTGVVITGANVTVRNLTTRHFRKGAEARDTTGVELREVTAEEMAGNGLNLLNTRNSLVVDCTAVDNTYDGIELDGSNGNEVRGSTARRNRDGIELENADDNRLANNVVCDNTDSQINIDAASSGTTQTGNNTSCQTATQTAWIRSPTRITSPGTYYIGGNIDHSGTGPCIEIVADDVTLEGRYKKVEAKDQGIGVRVTGSNVTVRNLVCTHVRIGIQVADATNVELRNNVVEKNAGDGIVLTETTRSLVVDNDCWDNRYDGIELERADDNEVRRNTCRRNQGQGIELRDVTGNTIANNVLCDNTSPFNVRESSGNTVTGNLTNCTVTGPRVVRTPAIYTVRSDISYSGTGSCLEITADNAVVRGNGHTLSGAGQGTGIRITGDNVVVDDLTVRNFRTGVSFDSAARSTVRGLSVTGNGGVGVSVGGGTENDVAQCLVSGSGGDGVQVRGATRTELRLNRVRGNDRGLYVQNATGTGVIQNWLCQNRRSNVVVEGSSGTTQYQNLSNCSDDPPRLRIVDIHPDDMTPDNQNMDDEYVVFENSGGSTLDLTGYRLNYGLPDPSFSQEYTYQFPFGFKLGPGRRVTVRSGNGTTTATDIWTGIGRPVLYNYGGTVRVTDRNGVTVLEQSYTGWED